MGWQATDETVAVGGSRWTEEQPTTWWDTVKGGAQTLDDAVRAAGNAVSFGMADRLAGLTSEGGTDEQVRLSEEARKRSPWASLGGDIGGAVLLPGIGGRALAARLAPDALAYGSSLGARALHSVKGALARGAGYGAEGAAIGAAQGAGTTYTGKPVDYLQNAATGGAVGGVLGAGMGSVFGPRGGMRSSAEVPNLEQAARGTDAAYDALRANQAAYDPAHFAGAANRLEQNMLHQGYIPDPGYSTAAFRATERMRDLPTNPMMPTPNAVTPYNIDIIRQGINKIPPAATADRDAGRMVKDALDEFIVNPPPGAVLPGHAAEAAQAGQQAARARQMRASEGRMETLDDIYQNAITQAAGRDSGLNVQNKFRQGIAGGLRQRRGESAFSRGGFNDPEIARLTEFARVPRGDAALRYVDRLFGGGGGLGAVVGGGVIGGAADKYFRDDPQMGLAIGAGVPLAGLALRTIGNRRATGQMNEMRDMIARRSPLYRERAAVAPMVPPPGGGTAASMRDAMTIELLRRQGLVPQEE